MSDPSKVVRAFLNDPTRVWAFLESPSDIVMRYLACVCEAMGFDRVVTSAK